MLPRLTAKAILILLSLNSVAWSAEIRNPHFGVCTHFAQKTPSLKHWVPETCIPKIADAGFGWIRDEILWREVELKPGVYQIPEKTRVWIDLATQADLKILVTFNNSNPIYENPFDPEAYAKAAKFVATALKGKIHALEILNEPFNFDFAKTYGGGAWNGRDEKGAILPWVFKYVELLNKAAEAVSEADPDLPVIGLGSTPPVDFRQLAMGISSKVRGITAHPYSFRTVPEIVPFADNEEIFKRDGIVTADAEGTFISQMRMFRETSLKNNGPREIWLTESGYTTFREGKPGRKPGRNPVYSGFNETAKAKYIPRRLIECLGIGVEKSFVYSFMDDGRDPLNPEHCFGLLDFSGNPKEAYLPVKRLLQATADLVPAEDFRIKVFPFSDRKESRPVSWDGITLATPGSIRRYAFRNAKGEPVIALWSTERSGDLQVRTADVEICLPPEGAKVKIFDLMTGEFKEVAFSKKGNHIFLERLAVPDYPILIYPQTTL